MKSLNKNCNNCYFYNNCRCSDDVCENYISLNEEEMLSDIIEAGRVEYRSNWFEYINEDINFFDFTC